MRYVGSGLMLLFAVLWLFPIYIVVVNSFKSRAEMYLSVLALPQAPTLEYYADALRRMDFLVSLRNSLIVTVASCLLIPFLASMCAWMMTRSGGRFSRILGGIFFKIVLPRLKPTTMTVIILDVIWIFYDYMLPALTLLSPSNRTIPLSTFSSFGIFKVEWNLAMAGLTLTIIPVVVFYLSAQQYIVVGVAAGAVKG